MCTNQEVCDKCKIYQNKRDEFLDEFNSAYDAAIEMRFFIEECRKTCPAGTKEVIFTRENETPSCEFCDNCQSGIGCEYCSEFTNYINYRRTVKV